MSVYIKYGALEYGDGAVGRLILIWQWPTIPKGRFVKISIPGLTNTTDTTKEGDIFLTSTRAANDATWVEIIMGTILPDIEHRSEVLKLDGTAVTFDGDALTLNALMTSIVQDKCKEQKTRIGKLGAARTKTDQPCDANKGGFLGTKDYLVKIVNEDINTENIPLENRMLRMIDEAIANTPGCKHAQMPLEYKRKYCKSQITVLYAMANSNAFHPATVAHSFWITGDQCPIPGEVGYEEPNFPVLGHPYMSMNPEKMLRRTMGEVKDSEMQAMIDAIPEAMTMLDLSGTLTREQMDYLKIPRLRDGTAPRENLAHCRHGAEIITKQMVWDWKEKFKEDRRKKTPEEQAAIKEAAANAKAIAEAEKRVQQENDRVEKARVKAAAVLAEKARYSGLSVAEKREEKKMKDAKTLKNKQDKAVLKQAQEAADRLLLANRDNQEEINGDDEEGECKE